MDQGDLIGSMEAAAIAAARGAAADIIAGAQLKAKAAADELRGTVQTIIDARRQALEAIEASRQEAEKVITATAEQATAKTIQAAEDRARQILSEAHTTAEQATAKTIQAAEDRARQILSEAHTTAEQIAAADAHAEKASSFDAEDGDCADPGPSTWQQAVTPPLLGSCMEMTAFKPMAVRTASGPRVLISHTSELHDLPEARSILARMVRAISASRAVIVEMRGFPDERPVLARWYGGQVCGRDLYIGTTGHHYGSPEPGSPAGSYTELEFRAAADIRFRGRDVEMIGWLNT